LPKQSRNGMKKRTPPEGAAQLTTFTLQVEDIFHLVRIQRKKIMGIKNNLLKMVLIICFFLPAIVCFSQEENCTSKVMVRYSTSCELKFELDKIIDSLKPVDQKLTFIINTFIKNDLYYISIATSYYVEQNRGWVGFVEYRGKLFLIESLVNKDFFTKSGSGSIELNIENKEKSNGIVEPYIDNLPFWLLEYDSGRFQTTISSYQ